MTDVFVFGSNLAGRHGRGAALYARQYCGARNGRGVGRQGNSYAIPTKGYRLEVLPIDEIARHVADFLTYARAHPAQRFQLTAVGCGLAGYRRDDIEPLFLGATPNVHWPLEWPR